ncbi:hypothetical protein G6F22_017671 [Rhizopus arrhizus]|nr:hypothetical protein G6F22_017671 [Rhizopus arrhizus]
MGDRQTFQVMPSANRGVPSADRRKRALSFERSHESARPYRYDVRFDNGIAAAIAPTDHAALFRFDFPEDGDANLLRCTATPIRAAACPTAPAACTSRPVSTGPGAAAAASTPAAPPATSSSMPAASGG